MSAAHVSFLAAAICVNWQQLHDILRQMLCSRTSIPRDELRSCPGQAKTVPRKQHHHFRWDRMAEDVRQCLRTDGDHDHRFTLGHTDQVTRTCHRNDVSRGTCQRCLCSQCWHPSKASLMTTSPSLRFIRRRPAVGRCLNTEVSMSFGNLFHTLCSVRGDTVLDSQRRWCGSE